MGEKPLAATKKKGSFSAILGCIGIIFLGCCLNNIALEFIIRLVIFFVSLWSLLYTSLTGFATQEFSCRLFDALSSSLF